MSYIPFISDPNTGNTTSVSELNALRTTTWIRLVGTAFVGSTKDTNFWAETNTGSGGTTQADGTVVISTGTTLNSTAQYQTVQLARFVSGNENLYRGILFLGDTGTANNIRNWGAFDANNGFFFQLNGTTLNIVVRDGGVDTATAKASWNVSTSFTLDTNIHIYEITYLYSGANFYIDGTLVHQIKNVGAANFPNDTLTLPVTIQNNNSGGSTTNLSITVGVSFIVRMGLIETENIFKNITTATTTTLKFGAGRLRRIINNNSNAANNTVTVYDNTAASGTLIGTVVMPKVNGNPYYIDYDMAFSNGLTVVTSAAGDITVIYE